MISSLRVIMLLVERAQGTRRERHHLSFEEACPLGPRPAISYSAISLVALHFDRDELCQIDISAYFILALVYR